MTAPVRLTSYSHGAGCACKLGPADLAQVLTHIPVAADPRVLVDASNRDDAAVFRMSDDRALVATVDFFTPVVDDPYDFGRVAAANALSDVYAMGGTPLLVLNLVGWPREKLPFELLGEILRGGSEIASEAGAFVLGGHSVDDPEPKYGMVAIGEVHPDRIVTNAGARPGDVLVLTKPIGTGVLTTALKRDLLPAPDLAPAVRSMTTLNAGAGRALRAAPVHAATDVTGFGLLGHLNSLLRASGAAAELQAGTVPLLPRVREMALQGAVPSGTRRNLASVAQAVTFDASLAEVDRIILADAQTSGGLLIAVPESGREQVLEALRREGTPAAAEIGRVRPGTGVDHGAVTAIPEYRGLTPDAIDALERAVREHRRVALRRRGTEYVVVAQSLETGDRDETLLGRLPMTGEVLAFRLRELESFAVLP